MASHSFECSSFEVEVSQSNPGWIGAFSEKLISYTLRHTLDGVVEVTEDQDSFFLSSTYFAALMERHNPIVVFQLAFNIGNSRLRENDGIKSLELEGYYREPPSKILVQTYEGLSVSFSSRGTHGVAWRFEPKSNSYSFYDRDFANFIRHHLTSTPWEDDDSRQKIVDFYCDLWSSKYRRVAEPSPGTFQII